MGQASVDLAGRPRWRGQPGRLEVHYLTATDALTGAGLWLHHEVVAPADGTAAYAHGWVARFPVTGPPSYERFGPAPAQPLNDVPDWFCSPDAVMRSDSAAGSAGSSRWQLAWDAGRRPLWTFPRWAWRRDLLPAAQVLPTPSARVTGTVNGERFDGQAATAHIYGHGNAHRWVWLHAELGDGDVLELVAAVARRRGLRRLPPLPLVQLRVDGTTWPGDPLAAAPLLRLRTGGDGFRVAGTVGARRIDVRVTLPPDRCVVVPYTDPDGTSAVCTNSARADVTVTTQRLGRSGWREEHSWQLDGTGHAEIGTRP